MYRDLDTFDFCYRNNQKLEVTNSYSPNSMSGVRSSSRYGFFSYAQKKPTRTDSNYSTKMSDVRSSDCDSERIEIVSRPRYGFFLLRLKKPTRSDNNYSTKMSGRVVTP